MDGDVVLLYRGGAAWEAVPRGRDSPGGSTGRLRSMRLHARQSSVRRTLPSAPSGDSQNQKGPRHCACSFCSLMAKTGHKSQTAKHAPLH